MKRSWLFAFAVILSLIPAADLVVVAYFSVRYMLGGPGVTGFEFNCAVIAALWSIPAIVVWTAWGVSSPKPPEGE